MYLYRTSPAVLCHINCLYVPNAAAQKTVNHHVKVLAKRAFLIVGVKEIPTCMPKLDEQLFGYCKVTYDNFFVFNFVQYSKTPAIYFPMLYYFFGLYIAVTTLNDHSSLKMYINQC